MKNQKHTPGPWAVETLDRKGTFHVAKDIGVGLNMTLVSIDESLATARIISAAPEMLEALERIQEILIDEIRALKTILPVTEMLDDIKTVIAKAKGGA